MTNTNQSAQTNFDNTSESTNLVDADVMNRYDEMFAAGSDKSYPNLELVRLEMTFFDRKPGTLLEYAFGSGVNTLHMAEKGYQVTALDASKEAKKLVERKLSKRPDIQDKVKLELVSTEQKSLDFDDNSFDYVVVMSLFSLLGSKERADTLLKEFHRILKPGGKIIADVNSARGNFALEGKNLGNDVYENRGHTGKRDPIIMWCPETAETLVDTMSSYFEIDNVGYIDLNYMTTNIHEFIVCAHKPV